MDSSRSAQPAPPRPATMTTPTGASRGWRWRIGLASAAVGAAAVVSGLRADLELLPGLVTCAVFVIVAVVVLRGVHHRVDQEKARGQVFYSGEGSTPWYMILFIVLTVAPALLVSWIPDPAWRALVAGVIGAMAASASHAVLAATTTSERQPSPEPVPLDR